MLNDLFEQIFHSEATFKERITQLKQVNVERQARNTYLKDLDQQYSLLLQSSHNGQVTLVESNVQKRLLDKNESLLADQRKEEFAELERLRNEKESLEEAIQLMQQQYVAEATAFYASHDLAGKGRECRLAQNQHDCAAVLEEANRLQQEYAILEAECQSSDQLASVNVALETELADLLSQQNALNDELAILKEVSTTREHEKNELEVQSSTDPEFIRLHRELDAAQNERFEALCKELCAEVKTLQEEIWRKKNSAKKSTPGASRSRKLWQGDGREETDKSTTMPAGKSNNYAASSSGSKPSEHTSTAGMNASFDKFWSDDDDCDDDIMVIESDISYSHQRLGQDVSHSGQLEPSNSAARTDRLGCRPPTKSKATGSSVPQRMLPPQVRFTRKL